MLVLHAGLQILGQVNQLYSGDNLEVPWEHIADEKVT
jgi:hypothetical protein